VSLLRARGWRDALREAAAEPGDERAVELLTEAVALAVREGRGTVADVRRVGDAWRASGRSFLELLR
jgi:hypothetical protein